MSTIAIGLGVATAAFLGRAGLVAYRRSKGGVNAMGKAFYKGGFEQRMTRREAALILELPERTLNKDKVRKKHRQLMLLNHPDQRRKGRLAAGLGKTLATCLYRGKIELIDRSLSASGFSRHLPAPTAAPSHLPVDVVGDEPRIA
ncbi:hypothetical protein CBS115988_6366 [Aspergillus niger]|nr:hypothetical protein CBS11350_1706 [Aspergillus niger]KAI2874256.1 hypothetical protein CBS115988_6366 [Aspergillus niger]KAI2912231.1 hypothetical protein CBS147371_7614 [Aspergillus niger]KAI3030506.1 hypothetical protein CBS147345_1827 [Aspergillus niger]KAI3032268.1 hypothetical protein CBS147347_1438 [Aspergillus niger]